MLLHPRRVFSRKIGVNVSKTFYRSSWIAALAVVTCVSVARAQEPVASAPSTDERRTVGTVTSIGRGSIVVSTDEGKFVVYSVEPAMLRASALEPGSMVRVITLSTDTDPAPAALAIDKLPARQGLAPQQPDAVPLEVRRLEKQIQRQARRYRAGLTAGAALDPELISVDAFATFGPIFQRSLSFRPNVELAFGEMTTLIGLHFEMLYSLPGLRSSIPWAPYIGAGPNFSFSHRGVDEDDFLDDGQIVVDDGRFDFDQYAWNNGFNFIVGARNPNGVFFEMKATAYGVANIRMLAGFEF